MAEQWMTYKAVAEALGVQTQAVRKRQKHWGWPQRKSNETGLLEIKVDLDKLTEGKPESPEGTPNLAVLEAKIASLEAQVSLLRETSEEKSQTIDKLLHALTEAQKARTGFFAKLFGR